MAEQVYSFKECVRRKAIGDVAAHLNSKYKYAQGSVLPSGQRAHAAKCGAFRGARQGIPLVC